MKKLFLFTSILFFLQSSAQELTYILGQPIKVTNKEDFVYAGFDNENYYIVRTVIGSDLKRAGFLEGFSRTTMNKIFSTQLDVRAKNAENFALHQIVATEKGIRVFYSYYDKVENFRYAAITEYDKTGNAIGNMIEIDRAAGTTMSSGEYSITYDKDSKNTLIIHTTARRGYDQFGMKPNIKAMVIDNDLKTIWKKDILMTAAKAFDWNAIAIDKSGNFYMKGYIVKKSVTGSYVAEFFSYNWKKDLVKEEELMDDVNIRNNGVFVYDNERNLFYTGMIGAKGIFEVSGLYVAKFNTDDAGLVSQKINNFNKPAPGEKKKAKTIYDNFGVSEVILDDDKQLRISGHSTGKWYVEFRFDTAGELKSTNFFNSLQEIGQGVVALHKGTEAWYIYNDLPENLDKTDRKALKEAIIRLFNKGIVQSCYAKLSGDTVVEKKVLIPNQEGVVDYLWPKSFRISNQEVISMYAQGNEKYSFINFKVK
jgi:hypothetical protein